ncbi:hypothetical protein RHSIM_Rhsim01G0120400 [Rhododendron simsii]|uniref:Cytochrome P450 n=1 Tax=Rhododendron simsii TaxID=118357 RepID=A0A834LV89_RHOSS|nr:hypothetical protein RHSIM_Rhsim01G0120400 [Rhododendron simsii]
MQTQDVAFANRPPILAVKSMTYNYVDIAFCPYGDYWRQMRKICILELLSAKNVRAFSSIREDEVFHLIESIKTSSGSPINLANKILSLTNDIIFRAAFGKRYGDQDALMPLMKESIELAGGFNLCDLFPSFKVLHFLSGMKHKLVRLHEKMDQILENIIDEHEENRRSSEGGNGEAEEEDLLDVLLRLKHSAGTEASSNTVEWAMSEMVRNPRVMEKAQAELRQALQGKKRIGESDIQGLKYLKLVIKETLRLYPSALLLRECREQAEIDGFRIPVKTQVIVNAWAMGRDPEYWDDAEKFSPERFDNSPVDLLGNDFQYIPFGAGRRKCPGMTFGLANIELPLAQLLYHFNWELPGGAKPEDLDMRETFGATLYHFIWELPGETKPGNLDMRETFGATVRRISNLHLVATPHYFT